MTVQTPDWLPLKCLSQKWKGANADKVIVFTHPQNRGLEAANQFLVTEYELVKKQLEAAGLDSSQYSSHKLRHTAATLMLQNGVDVRAVQEVLGHDHLNTTEIYTHIDNESLRIAAKANPLSNVKLQKKPQENE